MARILSFKMARVTKWRRNRLYTCLALEVDVVRGATAGEAGVANHQRTGCTVILYNKLQYLFRIFVYTTNLLPFIHYFLLMMDVNVFSRKIHYSSKFDEKL